MFPVINSKVETGIQAQGQDLTIPMQVESQVHLLLVSCNQE